jgi:hypothetical protein
MSTSGRSSVKMMGQGDALAPVLDHLVEEGADRGDLRVLAPDLAAEIRMPERIALQLQLALHHRDILGQIAVGCDAG